MAQVISFDVLQFRKSNLQTDWMIMAISDMVLLPVRHISGFYLAQDIKVGLGNLDLDWEASDLRGRIQILCWNQI